MIVSLSCFGGRIGPALPCEAIKLGLAALNLLPDQVETSLLLTRLAALHDNADNQHEADTEKAAEGRSRQGHRRLQI